MKIVLEQFRDEMRKFSSKSPVESPIVVYYDKHTHILTYRHLNYNIGIPFMRSYYYAKKNFRLGLLTPKRYYELLEDLDKLISDPELDKELGSISFSVSEMCLKVLKTYSNSKLNSKLLIGPQDYIDIKFVNMTNPISVWLFMRFRSIESRTLYKIAKKELKLEKENKKNKIVGEVKEVVQPIVINKQKTN